MGIKLCDLVLSDFLSMPFENDHFDAAYAIEATCHSPTVMKQLLEQLFISSTADNLFC